MTELGELIADDRAVDMAEWLDLRLFEAGCPLRLVAIAQKISQGVALSHYDKNYLWRFRKREQKKLSPMVTFCPPRYRYI
jgi:hypothetical protein